LQKSVIYQIFLMKSPCDVNGMERLNTLLAANEPLFMYVLKKSWHRFARHGLKILIEI